MPPVSQSREVLTAMDSGQPLSTLSFGRKNGCFVPKNVALILAALFLGSLLATGLLVYYYATPHRVDNAQSSSLTTPLEASSLVPSTAGIIGTPPPTVDTTDEIIETTTTQAPPVKKTIDVRLPRSIMPIRYVVRLQPLINGNYSILGSVEVTMKILEPTKNITMHMADIISKNDTVKIKRADDPSAPAVPINEQKYDVDREFYIAMLDKELMKDEQYVLSMDFEGYLNDQLKGFYRSSYTDEDGEKKMLATTQFQATDARRAFPCFDEPALKAEFEIYLARETNMSAISNMPRIDTMPIDDQPGWVWDHFNTSVPMSTYLVAFVVSDFEHINSTANNNTLFRVWARKSAIDQAEYAKQIGPDITTYFENYFSIPFPLPKQDMIALPDFSAGAMENWGLITYRETALLYDAAVSSASSKQRVAAVVAHELAHQWFGDLVTPSWWTDLWLNEGFASYLENLGVDSVHPSWKMMEQFLVDDLHAVFALDCLESSHPISVPVGHPDEIGAIFDRISYNKGASIIRMMNHFLSEPTLQKGLTNYLNNFTYDSAEQDDLWRFLTAQAQSDGTLPADLTVKEIMDTWTLQMGYPVINVTVNSDGSAKLTQERFLMVKNPNSTDTHNYMWWVPISYTTEDSADFNNTQPSLWMSQTDSTKMIESGMPTSSDQWVIFNIQQTGYYKVNYNLNNWKQIIRQLNEDHTKIDVSNRAQIIDDALDLARAGLLNYEITMDVISYLGKETEYVPWRTALVNLGYVKNMLSRTGAYGSFKRYMISLLEPLYQKVGFVDKQTDPHLDQLIRVQATAWMCKLNYKDCVDRAVNLFGQWMNGTANKSIVSTNLKSSVYCAAVAQGSEAEWNFLWKEYMASNVASEKKTMMSSLGCSKELWILSGYLTRSFKAGGGVRKQDVASVFAGIARNEHGRDLAWNYLRNNWKRITEYYSSGLFTLGRLVEYATTKFNSQLMLEEVTRFRDRNLGDLKSSRRTVDQSVERTKNNIAWMDAHYDEIENWLSKKGF
ncbi:Peptidase M1 membrane alanine aminopeptidase N-terminal [Trinorchestia longiramus]|nr:Peptidase M1 membrane alanine aminopeptidase N-terminal [Trinorchestia longiramus]